MSQTTRLTAKLATWGLILTIGGLVLLGVAAHHSLFFSIWSAVDRPLMVERQDVGFEPQTNWAASVAVIAGVAIVAGLWCLVAVIWRIADRADVGRPGVVHTPGAPLPSAIAAATLADPTPSANPTPSAD